jgi:hypothetical protein
MADENRNVNITLKARDEASKTFDQVANSMDKVAQAAADINGGPASRAGRRSASGSAAQSDSGFIGGFVGAQRSLAVAARAFVGSSVLSGAATGLTGLIHGARGETDKMLAAFERLPLGIGQAVRAGHELFDVLSGSAAQAERLSLIAGARAGVQSMFGSAGGGPLSDMASRFRSMAETGSLFGDAQRRAQIINEGRDNTRKIDDALNATLKEVNDERTRVLNENLKKANLSGVLDEDSLMQRAATLRTGLFDRQGTINRLRDEMKNNNPNALRLDAAQLGTRQGLIEQLEQRNQQENAELRTLQGIIDSVGSIGESRILIAQQSAESGRQSILRIAQNQLNELTRGEIRSRALSIIEEHRQPRLPPTVEGGRNFSGFGIQERANPRGNTDFQQAVRVAQDQLQQQRSIFDAVDRILATITAPIEINFITN